MIKIKLKDNVSKLNLIINKILMQTVKNLPFNLLKAKIQILLTIKINFKDFVLVEI